MKYFIYIYYVLSKKYDTLLIITYISYIKMNSNNKNSNTTDEKTDTYITQVSKQFWITKKEAEELIQTW